MPERIYNKKRITTELKKEWDIYIMDEPTTGLQMSAIDNFYMIVKTLVKNDNTLIIIGHNHDNNLTQHAQ